MKRRLVGPDNSNVPVTAIILCAGGSTRMGTPKGLLDVAGTPLLVAHVAAARAAGLAVRVVLGSRAEDHQRVLPAGVDVVLNPAWATTGMAESLALALVDGPCLVTPVDVPPPRAATLRALLEGAGDAVPTWSGEDGHPVRLDPPHPPGRLDVRLRGARRLPVEDPEILYNLNTPADWAAWRRRAGE